MPAHSISDFGSDSLKSILHSKRAYAYIYYPHIGQWRARGSASHRLPGCAPPKVYPPWKQFYNTFARWRQRGVWDVLLALLRQQVHAKAGRQSKPSKAIN